MPRRPLLLLMTLLLAACGDDDGQSGPVCGNAVLETGETCDGTAVGSATCANQGHGSGVLACLADCSALDFSGCDAAQLCGNDTRDGDEVCDGEALSGETCVSQGFTGGTLRCALNCRAFVTLSCTGGPSVCGDDLAEGDEVCDGDDLRGETCATQGLGGGTLACAAGCDALVTTGCHAVACGDGVAEGDEVCDGDDLRGVDCVDRGYTGGTLACQAGCGGYLTAGCTGFPTECGNDLAEGDELCDGVDLRGRSCALLGFTSGTLACDGDCAYDTTGCTGTGPDCGDEVAAGLEACDGADLRAETCVSLGYPVGTLACSPQCTSYVTAGCTGTNPTCGDDEAEGLEVCDGDDLRGQTCQGLGFVTGPLACQGDCAALDDSSCGSLPTDWTCGANLYAAEDGCDCNCGAWDPDCDVPGATYGCEDWEICVQPGVCENGGTQCGNAIAEGYEWCDGDDLRGRDCASVGYAGGVLACAWSCAEFDVSGCIGSGPVCGNAVADGTEACDLLDLRGRTCGSFGYTGGDLACKYDCSGFDFSGCAGGIPGWTCPPSSRGTGDGCDCGCGQVDPDCGNATVEACARCNGPGSCGEGGPVCPGAIDPANNAVCESSVGCGNGTAEGVEMCDGADLRSATCALLGLPSGTLLCRADCAAFVTTGCNGTGPECGDDVADGAEWCDGADLRGLDCTTYGYTSGTLACISTCNGFDDSGCL